MNRHRPPRPVVALALLAAAVAGGAVVGCARAVTGTPVAAEGAVATTQSRPPTTGRSTRTSASTAGNMRADVCSLLTFRDLPYRSTGGSPGPSGRNIDKDYPQSCRFTVHEFRAGYEPPPFPDRSKVPDRNRNGTNDDEWLEEMGKVQQRNNENSMQIGVSLRYGPQKLKLDGANGKYTAGGREISYRDDPGGGSSPQPACTMVLEYAGGGLGIIVVDGTNRYGPTCEQGKKVIDALLSREPK